MNHLTNGQWKNRIVLEIETSEEVGAEEKKTKGKTKMTHCCSSM